MLKGPFLTENDSRATIKGSRDPLGIQPIWARFGRCVIGNLTMASSSVRDFTTLLLGFYFTKRVTEENKTASTLETFLKWEQIAAYARFAVNKDGAFRGIERVKARLVETSRVKLSADSEGQILSDQKNYGLWGLYTIPARASGLIDGELPQLSSVANDFVQNTYLSLLNDSGIRNEDRIINLLNKKAPRIDIEGKEKKIAEAIAKVLKKKLRDNEIDFYRTHLLYGGPNDTTRGLQKQLSYLIKGTIAESAFVWSPTVIVRLIKKANGNGENWAMLASKLNDIRHSESVLAPVSDLFGYLLGCLDADVSDVMKRIYEVWGKGLGTIDLVAVRELRDKFAGGDNEVGDRWVRIAETLVRGEYDKLLELVLEQNRSVMSARGGSPWIVKAGNNLDVRFREEGKDLPNRAYLAHLWRFPYFLDSFRKIAVDIEGGSP